MKALPSMATSSATPCDFGIWGNAERRDVITLEEDLEEAICTARHDSFEHGPEMAAKRRLAQLDKSKRAANGGWGPPLTPAQRANLRLLTLLYPQKSPSLREHIFRDSPVADDDTVLSQHPSQRPASTNLQPDSNERLVEFIEDRLPPYCTVDRELSEKKGRRVLKWTFEKY
jgi:hypothetical protein